MPVFHFSICNNVLKKFQNWFEENNKNQKQCQFHFAEWDECLSNMCLRDTFTPNWLDSKDILGCPRFDLKDTLTQPANTTDHYVFTNLP